MRQVDAVFKLAKLVIILSAVLIGIGSFTGIGLLLWWLL